MLYAEIKKLTGNLPGGYTIPLVSAILCGVALCFLPGKIVFSAIFAAIFVFLILEKPETCVYFMIFCFPFVDYPRLFGADVYSGITLSNAIGIITVLLFIFHQIAMRKVKFIRFPILPYFILFIASIILSTIAAADLPIDSYKLSLITDKNAPGTTGISEILRSIQALLIMFSIVFFIDDRKKISMCWNMLIISSISILIHGYYQYIGTLLGFFSFTELRSYSFGALGNVPRMISTLREPQGFGNYMLAVIIFTLAKYSISKRRSYAMLTIITLQFISLILTFSTGAYLGLISALIVFIVLSKKHFVTERKKELVKIVIALLVLLPVIAYFSNIKAFIPMLETVFTKIWSKTSFSSIHRSWLRAAGWNMFKANPLFGVGPGNFGFLYNFYKPLGAFGIVQREMTNNQFVSVLAEQGIFGAVTFSLLFWTILTSIYKPMKRIQDPDLKILMISYISIIIGFLFQFVSTVGLFRPYIWPIIALSQACVILGFRTAKTNSPSG